MMYDVRWKMDDVPFTIRNEELGIKLPFQRD